MLGFWSREAPPLARPRSKRSTVPHNHPRHGRRGGRTPPGPPKDERRTRGSVEGGRVEGTGIFLIRPLGTLNEFGGCGGFYTQGEMTLAQMSTQYTPTQGTGRTRGPPLITTHVDPRT